MTSSVRGDLASFLSGTKPARSNPSGIESPWRREEAADLVARIMRPERPNGATVLAAAVGAPEASGAGLWESLVGTHDLPAAWLDDHRRLFAADVRVDAAPFDGLEADLSRAPSRATAAALASDPRGVELAEELIRECCARLTVFAPERHEIRDVAGAVAWEVTDPRSVSATSSSHLLPFVGTNVLALRNRADMSTTESYAIEMSNVLSHRGAYTRTALADALMPRYAELGETLATNITGIAVFFAQFEALRATGVCAPRSWGTLRDRPFAELPNPWRPLLELYRQGYALRGFLKDDGWIPLLLCPKFTSSRPPPSPPAP